MSEAAAASTETIEQIAPPPEQEADLAPPEQDPYFRKADGTPVTGEKANGKSNGKAAATSTNRDAAGKFAKAITETALGAEPAKEEPATKPEPAAEPVAEAKPTEEAEPTKAAEAEKAAKEKQQQTIGAAWQEVKAQKKEVLRAQAEINAARAEIARAQAAAKAEADAARAEREAAKAELEEVRKDFRGYLKKHGLSFRELVEADLTEEEQAKAADPKERELAEAKRVAAEAKAAVEELKAERQREREEAERAEAERAAAAERQEEIRDIGGYIAANAAEYPYLAHYKHAAQEIRDAFYANEGSVNIYALIDKAEQHLAKQDEELAPARNGKQAAEEPATAARAQSRNGSRVAEEPEEKPVAETQRQARTSTLTNRTAAARQSAVNTASLSPEDRKAHIARTVLKYRSDNA